MQHCIWSPTAGVWSSPPTTGSRPPPCSNFTFEAIDSNRGVLFGGHTEHGRMNVYIINVQTMVCLCVVLMYIKDYDCGCNDVCLVCSSVWTVEKP